MPSLNTSNVPQDSETLVSPVVAGRPDLTVSPAAINSEPVELDSTPASPPNGRQARRASRLEMLDDLSTEERQKRDQLMADRKGDPAVMADLPKDPTADELEKSGATTDSSNNQTSASS